MKIIRKYLKLIITFSVILLIYCYSNSSINYPSWVNKSRINNEWIPFSWVSEKINGKTREKVAIILNCKINGISNVCSFQLDLGAEITGIYEFTYSSLPKSKSDEIKRLKSHLLFRNQEKYIANIDIRLGGNTFKTEKCYVYNEMGEKRNRFLKTDTIHLGTIGRDFFKNKILIIDYPNARIKILNKVPSIYQNLLSKIEIDESGKIILPLQIKRKKMRITFDTGSSLFQLITTKKKIHHFTNSKNIDTLDVFSWGLKHQVTSKLINEPIRILNHRYDKVKIYVNHTGQGIDESTDAMIGNALFLENIIIIDYPNKQFGILK